MLKAEDDEHYLIEKSKPGLSINDAEARAWALTAKSLIPRNFSLLHEAYWAEKTSKNAKESAKILSRIYMEFPNEPQFWNETKVVFCDLDNHLNTSTSKFHAELISHLHADVQQQILLQLIQTIENPVTQGKLTIILFEKFPQTVSGLWQKAVERLTKSELNAHVSPCNAYRKILIHDLLPLILKVKGAEIPQTLLLTLLQKAIEFYVSYLAKNDLVIKELSETESKLENPMQKLTWLLSLVSAKVGWKLGTEAFNIENKAQLCQILWSVCNPGTVTTTDKKENRFVELYYYTVFTLFKSLFEYLDLVGPTKKRDLWSEMPQVLLVHNLFVVPDLNSAAKRESPGNPILLTTPKLKNLSRRVTENFAAAISCWELLHNFDELRHQFAGLYESLRITSWPWFQTFMVDVLLYRSLYDEAAVSLNHLLAVATGNNKMCLNLKLASVLYISGKKTEAITNVLQLIPLLPPTDQTPLDYFELSMTTDGYSQRVLTFMNTTSTEILRFVVHMILSTYCDIGLSSCSDTVLGISLILLQFDWPRNSDLAEVIVDRIRSKGTFKYPLLPKYFINIDVLEEFMLMASDHGGNLLLDIFPNVSSQAKVSTRGGSKESKEDFKQAMFSLVAQCGRPLYKLLTSFLQDEKETIIQTLK
ncbi:integrator complex subunit 10-like [Artemia franciscana]|uniref:Integrator complex subunit 10 n=1 Tax=Artemia franciscana TaxID=6661 RepID=A0AA88HWX5_ARTSF|nr:hypothetical protein QYM36_006559 [Artemia franciscana]